MSEEAVTRFHNGPRPLAAAVERSVSPAFRRHGAMLATLVRHWPQLVGPAYCRHTAPQRLTFMRGMQSEGTLTVACVAAFQTELSHMGPLIVERIELCMGYRLVAQLRFMAGAFEPPRAVLRPTLSPAAVSALAGALQSVGDDRLKAALQCLGEAIIAREAQGAPAPAVYLREPPGDPS